MSFSTLIFIAAFLPLFLFFYFLVPGIRNKNRILLLFSLIFYSFAGLGCLLLLLALGTMSWYIGEQIEKAMAAEEAVLLPGKDGEIPEKKKPGRKARRWLQGGVAALLLVLIFSSIPDFCWGPCVCRCRSCCSPWAFPSTAFG